MFVETLILTALVILFLINDIGVLKDIWGETKLPEEYQIELSGTDNKKISASKKLIKECFGNNITRTFKEASNIQRIEMTANFAHRLAELYELDDVNIDVTIDEAQKFGLYNWANKKVVFNIVLLTVEAENTNFDYCVRETIDTIIHELRHAVQHKAIDNPGFWNINDETRKLWAENRGNYIRPEIDMKGYASQPIEKDAVTFTANIMEGVC